MKIQHYSWAYKLNQSFFATLDLIWNEKIQFNRNISTDRPKTVVETIKSNHKIPIKTTPTHQNLTIKIYENTIFFESHLTKRTGKISISYPNLIYRLEIDGTFRELNTGKFVSLKKWNSYFSNVDRLEMIYQIRVWKLCSLRKFDESSKRLIFLTIQLNVL